MVDADQIPQPDWSDVFDAYVSGAEDAKANPRSSLRDYRREEIKKAMLEKYTSSSTIKGLENASLEVIMTRQQETMFQVMLTSALESYKHNLVQTFHRAGNVDFANKLNELQVLIPDADSARINFK